MESAQTAEAFQQLRNPLHVAQAPLWAYAWAGLQLGAGGSKAKEGTFWHEWGRDGDNKLQHTSKGESACTSAPAVAASLQCPSLQLRHVTARGVRFSCSLSAVRFTSVRRGAVQCGVVW